MKVGKIYPSLEKLTNVYKKHHFLTKIGCKRYALVVKKSKFNLESFPSKLLDEDNQLLKSGYL